MFIVLIKVFFPSPLKCANFCPLADLKPTSIELVHACLLSLYVYYSISINEIQGLLETS